MIGLALLAALQAGSADPPPAPTEDGLQPPMTFACHVSGPAGEAHLEGRIVRFYLKMAPGTGLLAIPQSGSYTDHVVVEIEPSALSGLAGRYDVEARFPLETDKMILTLPAAAATSGGYTLIASPARFGVGYQAFTQLRVERADSPTTAWTGPCTTTLPKPGKKP